MAKIGEIELKCAIRPEPNDLAHRLHEGRPAIGREAHNLVLVAVMRKAQILGQRLIEDAERMREIDPPTIGDVTALADAPGRAGEVPESIDRNDDGLRKWRNVESRGKMGQMMFNLVHLTAEELARKVFRQQ